MAQYWGEKRYYSLDYYIKQTFGEKLYKISLDGGMTCPNRDGKIGTGGCIFCSRGGSGDFAARKTTSITDQIETGKAQSQGKFKGNHYIAYFQAYTNTYAPLSYLEACFTEAINHPDIRMLSIATRPDCLADEVIDLLKHLNQMKPVWVELGLQTIHKKTSDFIRRGYDLPVFEEAVRKLRLAGIQVIVHTILYLPGESEADMLATLDYLNHQNIQGIKLQLLHVLDDTDLADYYKEQKFYLPDRNEYLTFLGRCIASLRPDMVIHRVTGDGPKSILIEPQWTGNKRLVLNTLQKMLKDQDIWQGKDYC